jgi:adenosylcobinamide kinase/adenosylcobinamide-phosphate guanylyltransferase
MIILITGGTRSGKSSYGEGRLNMEEDILYLATATITDEEMKHRVEHHQKRRGNRYQTVEGYKNMDKFIQMSSCHHTILDCVGTTITNILFERCSDLEHINQDEAETIEKEILQYFENIITSMKEKAGKQVIITNEVGMSLVSEYRMGRVFTDILGRVNQYIARQAEEVVLMVSGIPVNISRKS